MEKVEPEARCRNCKQGIYQYDFRWRHVNGMYTCTTNVPSLDFRAEPEDSHGEE